jgi:protocatechuate 3,4-dioxygenase beta subunit
MSRAGVPAWLRSRWVTVPGGIALVVLGWNLYVAANAGGTVEGRVVDAAGRPVPGATVRLYERAFITNDEKQRTTTDAAGRYRFAGNTSHAIQLDAEGPSGGRSPRMTVRLWFRAQDRRVDTPLRLPGGAAS